MKKIRAILVFGFLLMLGTLGLGQTRSAVNASQARTPLAVVLLVDKSSTAPHYMPLLRQVVTQVLGSMMPDDKMMLCEFQESTTCLTRFTANPGEILDALETIKGKASSSANFSDALDLAMDHLQTAAPGPKRAVIMVSNAGERFRPSRHSQADLIQKAQNSGTQVHMIEIATHFGTSTYHVADSAAARREQLWHETGGGLYSFGVPELNSETTGEDRSRMEKLLQHELSTIATILNQIRQNAAPVPGEDSPADAATEESESPALHSSPAILTGEMWKAIGWLPADTETVMVARGGFVLPDLSKDVDDAVAEHNGLRDQIPVKDIAAHLELDTVMVMAYLPELGQQLSGQRVAIAVRGLRHPRDSATGEGLMRSEGCLVLILEKDLGQNALSSSAGPKITQETIASYPVLVAQDDEDTVLTAQPLPNIVIIATDRSYLAEVLARMAGRSGRRALPSSLSEWNHVDTSARFWAVRHFDHTQADEDPSSPFRPDLEAERDEQAVGVTFSLEPGKPALVTYLTGDKNFLAKVKSPYSQVEPEFEDVDIIYRELEPGVYQMSFNLTDDNSVMALSFRLGWLLGQGIEGL